MARELQLVSCNVPETVSFTIAGPRSKELVSGVRDRSGCTPVPSRVKRRVELSL